MIQIKFQNLILILAYVFTFLFSLTHCSVVEFDGNIIYGIPQPEDYSYEPIYALKDFKRKGHQNSSLCYNLNFEGAYGRKIWLIVGRRLFDRFRCNDAQNLIMSNSSNNILRFHLYTIGDESNYLKVSDCVNIDKTGLYTVQFAICRKNVSQTKWAAMTPEQKHDYYAYVSGRIEYKNPYGYLPAHRQPYFSFYMLASIFFALVFVVQICLNWKFRTELFIYHHFMTIILALTLSEMVLNYYLVWNLNKTGIRLEHIFILTNFVTVIRKSLSRMLLVCACSGVGISRPAISECYAASLYALTCFYFVLSLFYELCDSFDLHTSDDIDTLTFVLRIFVVSIDTCFYLQVFYALYSTVNSLTSGESYKSSLYNKFAALILVMCLSTVVFTVVEIDYIRRKEQTTIFGWEIFWFMEDGFQIVLNAIVITGVMFLWKPSRSSSQYAYHQQLPTTEEEAEKADLDTGVQAADQQSRIDIEDSEIDSDEQQQGLDRRESGKFEIDDELEDVLGEDDDDLLKNEQVDEEVVSSLDSDDMEQLDAKLTGYEIGSSGNEEVKEEVKIDIEESQTEENEQKVKKDDAKSEETELIIKKKSGKRSRKRDSNKKKPLRDNDDTTKGDSSNKEN